MERMDQTQAIAKAKQFGQIAFLAESESIIPETQKKLGEMRSQLAARGMVSSGHMVSETARIRREQIQSLVEARLKALLDAYELFDVEVDDQLQKQGLAADVTAKLSKVRAEQLAIRATAAQLAANCQP